jgi:hypothetical protein
LLDLTTSGNWKSYPVEFFNFENGFAIFKISITRCGAEVARLLWEQKVIGSIPITWIQRSALRAIQEKIAKQFFLNWKSYAGMEQGRLLRLITSKSAGSTPASATKYHLDSSCKAR